MKNMTLANIAAACGGTYHGNEEDQNKEVLSITTDSRKACLLYTSLRQGKQRAHQQYFP